MLTLYIESKQALQQLDALQTKALTHLVDEKLLADSSFVVFMKLVTDAKIELKDKL